jgi:cytochrome c peroxidase
MTINGVAFDVDFTDADVLEKIEKECKVVEEKANELAKEKENLSLAEGIRQECKIVKDFFDNVFGEGTSKEIFGDKDSLTKCINAYEDTLNSYQEQYQAYYDKVNKYSPDRLER